MATTTPDRLTLEDAMEALNNHRATDMNPEYAALARAEPLTSRVRWKIRETEHIIQTARQFFDQGDVDKGLFFLGCAERSTIFARNGALNELGKMEQDRTYSSR